MIIQCLYNWSPWNQSIIPTRNNFGGYFWSWRQWPYFLLIRIINNKTKYSHCLPSLRFSPYNTKIPRIINFQTSRVWSRARHIVIPFRAFAFVADAERGRGNLGAQEREGCANFPFPFPIGIRAQPPSHGPLCFITSPSLSPVCEKRAPEEEAVSASLPSCNRNFPNKPDENCLETGMGALKQRRFWATHFNRKWVLLPFSMPWR